MVKELSSWTISLLRESNAWFWGGLGGLWNWTRGLWPWFSSMEIQGQLVVMVVLLGISLYVFWKARSQRVPDRIFLAATWPALFGGFVVIGGAMLFYTVWFMLGFVAFLCVVFLGFFEVPIHWIFG